MSAMSDWATDIEEFREIRKQIMVGQVSMAKLMAVHPITVARWESGKRRIPEMAMRLARFIAQTSVKIA